MEALGSREGPGSWKEKYKIRFRQHVSGFVFQVFIRKLPEELPLIHGCWGFIFLLELDSRVGFQGHICFLEVGSTQAMLRSLTSQTFVCSFSG
jgi:hypothetical protein